MTAALKIKTIPMGPLDANCYIIMNDRHAALIDPGDDIRAISRILDRNGLMPEAILLTHLHFDHIYGAAKLAREWGLTPRAGAGERMTEEAGLSSGAMFGLPAVEPFSWKPLEAGEHAMLGTTCMVLATPGHSPGSLTYYFPKAKAAFTGDLIFQYSVGRTDLPGGNPGELHQSILHAIYTLPEDTVLYPGHGACTTVLDEREHNPFVRPENRRP